MQVNRTLPVAYNYRYQPLSLLIKSSLVRASIMIHM